MGVGHDDKADGAPRDAGCERERQSPLVRGTETETEMDAISGDCSHLVLTSVPTLQIESESETETETEKLHIYVTHRSALCSTYCSWSSRQ